MSKRELENLKEGLVTPLAVALAGVLKAYRCGSAVTNVLRGVELTVRYGECVFLAGPSGSGKSTLLSIVGCLLGANGGQITVLGNDLDGMSKRELAAMRLRKIGFVFQRFNLVRGLTAMENVCVPMTLLGVPKRKARDRAKQLLDEFGIVDKSNAHPANLSTGQCQRVALARALANDPALILADEPTASLDAENGQTAMKLLRRLTDQHGKTVIVVTHDTRILRLADRVHWLENGRIVGCRTPQQLQTSHESVMASARNYDVAELSLQPE